jgi:hypothetical protein
LDALVKPCDLVLVQATTGQISALPHLLPKPSASIAS